MLSKCHYCLTALSLISLKMQCINPVYYNVQRIWQSFLPVLALVPRGPARGCLLLTQSAKSFSRIIQSASSVSCIFLYDDYSASKLSTLIILGYFKPFKCSFDNPLKKYLCLVWAILIKSLPLYILFFF